MKIKQVLSRVGYKMATDGSLCIRGHKIYDLATESVQKVILDLKTQMGLQHEEFPLFSNVSFVLGLISSQEFIKKGQKVQCLDDRIIYPKYGVYMPTCQQYLELLSDHITNRREKFSNKKNLVDLGSGSGILPILFKEKSDFSG